MAVAAAAALTVFRSFMEFVLSSYARSSAGLDRRWLGGVTEWNSVSVGKVPCARGEIELQRDDPGISRAVQGWRVQSQLGACSGRDRRRQRPDVASDRVRSRPGSHLTCPGAFLLRALFKL